MFNISRQRFLHYTSAGIGFGMLNWSTRGDIFQNSTADMSLESVKKNTPEKLLRNAKIVLEASCGAQKGETLLVIADEKILPIAPALALAGLELGLIPTIIDIRYYLACEQYQNDYLLQSLKDALYSSNIVLQNNADTWEPHRPSYAFLTRDSAVQDKKIHTGEIRWKLLQWKGMGEWDVDAEKISAITKRTNWLMNLLARSEKGHIKSPNGTDFTFGIGKGKAFLLPVLGIVPFYGEVAVSPILENTSGLVVIDGPTQRGVRPSTELDQEPLTIIVEKGRVVDMMGEPLQLNRLKDYIASGDPPANSIDEIGILTTTLVENDIYYWSDGTHHHDRSHIAIGNNLNRYAHVHGPKHMDGEIVKPTISIDGLVITIDGIFQDEVM